MSHLLRGRRRAGFTLIELLVVIAIISILMGLLMPAVQKAREAANKISCANNLKQLGLAMQMYHNDFNRLPSSRFGNPGGMVTWAVAILPYIEQGNLYRLWDPNLPFGAQGVAQQGAVPVYFCPSRRTAGDGLLSQPPQVIAPGCVVTDPSLVVGALGDYAVCVGTTGDDQSAGVPPANGAFRYPKGVRFAEIRDGLSNTFLLGEKHVPLGHFGQAIWDCSTYDGHNPWCSYRSAGPAFPLAQDQRDQGWVFGSYHIGVTQFAYCDGSVHAIPNTTDPYILGLLAHRSDGQVIPDF